MKSHLKVKVHSLSTEMTYIRRMEDKWKNKAKAARQRQLMAAEPKEVAYKALLYAEKNFWSLRQHRTGMKSEARTTHLAYGFIRGVPYARMERICYGVLKGYGSSEPDWARIAFIVGRFSQDETNPQGFMQRFAEWVDEAKKWYEGNEDRIIAVTAARQAHRERLANDTAYQTDRKRVQAALEAFGRAKYKATAEGFIAQGGVEQSGSSVGS